MKSFVSLLVLLSVMATGLEDLWSQDGTGPLIDARLIELRTNANVTPLAELPTDESLLPADWLALVSWNIQVGGTSDAADADRPPLVAGTLSRLFSGSYQLLGAQEISAPPNATVLDSFLPSENENWTRLFFDTDDSLDNGIWLRSPGESLMAGSLLTMGYSDRRGQLISAPDRALHAPVAASLRFGDFDFTLINVHLQFADGDTAQSARELRLLLDYLDAYFQRPDHDPDVVIAGDFNIPSRLSGMAGAGGIVLDAIFDDDPRFQTGERRFVVAVHDSTSRRTVANGGVPSRNLDHFIFSADVLEELIQARRVQPEVLTSHPQDPEQVLTSDHFPVVALFHTRGDGIQLDTASGAPVISRVVNGGTFRMGIAPGAWVTIFGSHLAPVTRTWRAEEIVGSILPTELDGVQVRINGRPAAVYFISPNQLNVQAPDDTTQGEVSVEVLQTGQPVATATAHLHNAAPGLFTLALDGVTYPAAVHLDGQYVGDPALFGGLPARPARPGDLILLFGTGFGPTNPAVPAGEVFTGAAPLVNEVTVTVGNQPASLGFAGLSGAGLNQFNLTIPAAAPNGRAELGMTIAGREIPAGIVVEIESDVEPPPAVAPTAMIAGTPQTIAAGGNSRLIWQSSNAQTARIDRGIGSVALSGSLEVAPAATTTYTLRVEGPGGAVSVSTTVTVLQPQAAPTIMLTAVPATIDQGQTATLSWASSGATAVAIEPALGAVALSGSLDVMPDQTTAYTATAEGPGGTASASAQVEVRAAPPTGRVVISQIYGGGGNSGATLTNDFIELFNAGGQTVELAGWSVQYASANGGTWQSTPLSGAIGPGRYHLIQEFRGAGGSQSLPSPDDAGDIAMSATSGKVALLQTTELLTGEQPGAASIQDFVGYGAANFSEGTPAPALNNQTANRRRNGGCKDTANNLSDFETVPPEPRNSATTPNPCQ